MKTSARSIPSILLTAILIGVSVSANAQFRVKFADQTCHNSADGKISIHNMIGAPYYITMHLNPADTLQTIVYAADTLIDQLSEGNYQMHLTYGCAWTPDFGSLHNDSTSLTAAFPLEDLTTAIPVDFFWDTAVTTTIQNPEILTSAFAADSYILDGSTPVNFVNSSSGATAYLWDFGDGNSSITDNPSYSFSATGSYTITLTAFNSTGCMTTSSDVITVNAPTCPGNYFSSRQSYGPSSVPTARTMHTIAATATQGAIHVADRGEVNGNATVTIVNLAGQLISTQNMNGAALNIAVDGNTVYVVTVQYPDGSATSDRIFVTE